MANTGGSNWGVLIPRGILAVVFMYHGAQKLFGMFGAPPDMMEQLTKGIESWGWPAPKLLAYLVGITEFFGGICVGIGLMTRFWAMGLAITMAVAALKVHWAAGFSLPHGWEYCFVLGVLSLSVVVQGGGALSLDAFFAKYMTKPKKPPQA
jgi:putative oxidoreductase